MKVMIVSALLFSSFYTTHAFSNDDEMPYDSRAYTTPSITDSSTGQCGDLSGVLIKEIGIGRVSFALNNSNLQEPHSIYFIAKDGDKQYIMPVNESMNLNDPQGVAIVSMLKTAMVTGVKIKMYNTGASNCLSVSAIALSAL